MSTAEMQQDGTPAASPTPNHQQQQDAVNYVKSILGEPVTCTLDDGRKVHGTFLCVDRLQNIILTDVVERRTIDTADYGFSDGASSKKNKTLLPVQRHLAQAMVPGNRLVKVEIAESIHNTKIKR